MTKRWRAGNLIAEPGGRTYQYDAENRMITVNSGTVATYTYDALGRRTAKTVPGSPRVRYIYNLHGNVVAEFEGTSWMRGYAHAGAVPIGQYKSSQLFYSHKDTLGSTRVMSKIDRTVEECDDYLPYGELDTRTCNQPPPPTNTINQKFTGYERDPESGNDYAVFRYYSPQLGRFCSADPVGGVLTAPQSLNRYSYVQNDPLNRVDPLGLCDVVVGGIKQTGGTADTYVQDALAAQIGAISAYPYSGIGGGASVLDILAQNGPFVTDAAAVTAAAIEAAASDPGPINLFVFSGGAQAVESAIASLPTETTSRIASITYVSPGLGPRGQLNSGSEFPGQHVYFGQGAADKAATIIPRMQHARTGFPADGLDCKHNANCEFGGLFYSLMKRAGTPCSRPATFSRPQRRLAIPSTQQIAMSVFIRAMLYRFLGTVDVRLGPPLVQVVWSRIILDKELKQK